MGTPTHKFDAAQLQLQSSCPDLNAVILRGDPFVILAEGRLGRSMCGFIRNEERFKLSRKTIMDRLRYLRGALVGFQLTAVLPHWNHARLNGYSLAISELPKDSFAFAFVR